MKWFRINGQEYKVRVFDPEESFTILYGENTGRTLGAGAPMILDPIGTFFNYTLTVGEMKGFESHFDKLWQLLSFPRRDGILVEFPSGRRTMWTTSDKDGEIVNGFYAYVSTGKRKIKKIKETVNGDLKEVSYDSFSINFIATKAQVLPYE